MISGGFWGSFLGWLTLRALEIESLITFLSTHQTFVVRLWWCQHICLLGAALIRYRSLIFAYRLQNLSIHNLTMLTSLILLQLLKAPSVTFQGATKRISASSRNKSMTSMSIPTVAWSSHLHIKRFILTSLRVHPTPNCAEAGWLKGAARFSSLRRSSRTDALATFIMQLFICF